MIDQQLVIEVNLIAVMLIGSMGADLPYYFRAWLRTNLYHERAIASIRCF